MTKLTVNDIQLNVEVSRQGSQRSSLVLLHGFLGSTRSWNGLIADFATTYQVITIDLPGHGLSDSPSALSHYRMEQISEDILGILDELKLDKVHLLGYSMGGRVALHFAVTHPERLRSLTLESSSPGLKDPQERRARMLSDEATATRLERDGLTSFVEYWTNLPLFASQRSLPAHVRADVYAQRLQNSVVGLAGILRATGPGVQPQLWDALPELRLPTLLIAGALDEKYVGIGQQMAALLPDNQLPNNQLAIIPDVGHTVHLENPSRFVELVLEHLDKVEQSARDVLA